MKLKARTPSGRKLGHEGIAVGQLPRKLSSAMFSSDLIRELFSSQLDVIAEAAKRKRGGCVEGDFIAFPSKELAEVSSGKTLAFSW